MRREIWYRRSRYGYTAVHWKGRLLNLGALLTLFLATIVILRLHASLGVFALTYLAVGVPVRVIQILHIEHKK
jgi:hypothetical protein